jgi:hypothetical protein
MSPRDSPTDLSRATSAGAEEPTSRGREITPAGSGQRAAGLLLRLAPSMVKVPILGAWKLFPTYISKASSHNFIS